MTADLKALMAELREMHAETSPGPWGTFEDGGLVINGPVHNVCTLESEGHEDADGNFIVSAHRELPAILAALDAATAERDALAASLAKAEDRCEFWQMESKAAGTKAGLDNVQDAHDAELASVMAQRDTAIATAEHYKDANIRVACAWRKLTEQARRQAIDDFYKALADEDMSLTVEQVRDKVLAAEPGTPEPEVGK